MKVRNRYRERNRSASMKKYLTVGKMRDQHASLIVGAKRVGIGLRGWLRKESWRYQAIHYDINHPGTYFYGAVGMPVPDRFITKRVTVGSYDRLIGYLKLHVEPDQRYIEREEDEEEEEDE